MLIPFMPTVVFNICCPRDAVSRPAHVGTVGKNGLTDFCDGLYIPPTIRIPSLRMVAFKKIFSH